MEGYNIPSALKLGKNVSTDLIVVGGITNIEQRQEVADKGINTVAMCRPYICEPAFAKKTKEGTQTSSQ